MLRVALALDGKEREWMLEAACAGVDPGLFFPEKSGVGKASEQAQIRMLCLGCPVQPNCLEYSLAHHEMDGWWGGYGPHERRRLLREWVRSGRLVLSDDE
jgi:WhiB family redox-sensing transcriptional regulator